MQDEPRAVSVFIAFCIFSFLSFSMPAVLSAESTPPVLVLPEQSQAIVLPNTLADAAALPRIFRPGAEVRSQMGGVFHPRVEDPQQFEQAHLALMTSLGEHPEAAYDGKAVQATLEIRRAARQYLMSVGIAVREEDDAGCRAKAAELSWQEFARRWQINPAMNSGRG